MVNVNDISITSIETITAFDIVTGAYKWTLDELQNATIANTQETTDITGKQGRLLNTLKRNKAVTVSGNNGLLSGGMLETQVGNAFKSGASSVMVPEYVTVTKNTGGTLTATIEHTAVGTAGNEIEKIQVRGANGVAGKELVQVLAQTTGDNGESTNTVPGAGQFTYDAKTKTITFFAGKEAVTTGQETTPAVAADVEEGAQVLVHYFRKIQADVLENLSDRYSDKVALYIDAFAEDKCANVYHVQFYIPKADFNGNFNIEMGDSQSAHSFEARSLAGACGTTGALWTYTIFGNDAEDVA